MRKAAALVALATLLAVGAASASAPQLGQAPGCPVFPDSSPWNQRVDRLPVAADSDRVVASIGLDDHMHADFGSGLWDGGPIGIPITVVRGTQAKTRVSFDYADESDKGPYPIPANVAIEGGRASDGDRHALIVDRDRCKLYELFALYPPAAAAGRRAPARSGICARTGCGRQAGRPRTRPACRFFPVSRATRRSRAAGSPTRSASRRRRRAAPTSGRRGTSRATRPTRRCRRWASACG